MTKSGMRGFAAGLWIAAIVMAYFFYTGQKPAETEAKQPITKGQVQQYLESHDQIAVGKAAYESLKTAAADQQQPDTEKKAESGNEKTTKDESKNNNDKNDKKSGSEEKADQKSEKTNHSYTLDIEQGMTSRKVGSLLEKAGIISDKEELLDYLQDHDLAKEVQLGTFKLNSDMSIAEIAREITS